MIRPYDAQDLEQLLSVWYAASKVAHPFLSDSFLTQEREDISHIYLPQTETWVYEIECRVVGFISLMENEVGAIFVDPTLHGQGIGRALMDKAYHLRPFLELDVFRENPIGRGFYKKYGFRQIGEAVHAETGFVTLRLRLDKSN